MMRINLPEEFVHRSWQELRPLAAPIGGAICAAVVITFLFRPAVAPGLLPRTDSATIVVKAGPADTRNGAERKGSTDARRAGLLSPTVVAAPAVEHAPTTIPVKQILHLPASEVTNLYEHGQALIAEGDYASARLLLTRATEAGHADAAFALASSFDPNELAKARVRGLGGEADKAREYYALALAHGVDEARTRLQALGG